MSDSLVAKLDQLHDKVAQVTRSLAETRLAERRAREQAENLARENERLKKMLTQAQGQINQMINQWFPELELSNKDEHGNA